MMMKTELTVERCRHCGCPWICPDCGGVPGATHYQCSSCGAVGCKLWRSDALPVALFCAHCSLKQASINPETVTIDADGFFCSGSVRTDELYNTNAGQLVPAVPLDDPRTAYAGVHAPPQRIAWWRSLPNTPKETFDA